VQPRLARALFLARDVALSFMPSGPKIRSRNIPSADRRRLDEAAVHSMLIRTASGRWIDTRLAKRRHLAVGAPGIPVALM